VVGKMKVFAGQATEPLAAEICQHLGIDLGQREVIQFSNDNTFVKINENVRECDVFVVQTACPPINHNLMELLIMIDALSRASAHRITAVLPFYPYGRSDKKDQPRVPITARLVADLLTTAGADRVVTVDLHSPQIQGFFTIPLDHLTAADMLCDYFMEKGIEDLVVVATDAGGAKKAAAYAERMNAPLAIGDKRRQGNNDKATIANFIGDVKDKNCVILDDEIDTGGTVRETAKALRAAGAKDIYVGCSHPVFSGPAIDRLLESNLKEIVVTNTLPVPQAERLSNLKVLSVGPIIAETIRRINEGESVSTLFRS
jgi:ribose-phosphate pyrophosphokinase